MIVQVILRQRHVLDGAGSFAGNELNEGVDPDPSHGIGRLGGWRANPAPHPRLRHREFGLNVIDDGLNGEEIGHLGDERSLFEL